MTGLPPARGFTFVETAVVVAIAGIVLAVGLPSMSNWLLNRKAAAAATFYQDAFTLARNTAIAHNAHTRLVLTPNAANGKLDWQVDLCVQNTAVKCDADNDTWSTPTAAAGGPDGTDPYKSIGSAATAMPGAADLNLAVIDPDDATSVYFTPLGWVDTSVATPVLKGFDLTPGSRRAGAFARIGVRLTLAGIAVICSPDAAAGNARGCPP